MNLKEFDNKRVLVTGGSGFLGEKLTERLINTGAKVVVMARGEGKLISLKEKFPTVEILTGDVACLFDVRQAMKNVDGVFHLAASKHIGMAEVQVRECVKSNVLGSTNILGTSLETQICPNLKFVLGISTDKAAQISGVYGATKFLMERLFSQYSNIADGINYRIVRYGNVLYSTGSVLCKWRDRIRNGQSIIMTDPNATRFFWTVDSAVDLIFECMANATDSSPFVPNMKAATIGDLCDAMIRKYLPNNMNIESYVAESVEIIGLQPGENLHEKILESGAHSGEVDRYTVDELKKLV